MNTIEISESVEDALQKVRPPKRGVMGNYYQTFRIRGGTSKGTAGGVVSRLVAAGWHLAGGPVHVKATGEQPEHVVLTMVWQEPRPIEFRGDLRFEGGGTIKGGLHAE